MLEIEENTELRDFIESKFREQIEENICNFLSMDLEAYQRFVQHNPDEHEITDPKDVKGYNKFVENIRMSGFNNSRFEENLDKIGVRYYDLHQTYEYEQSRDMSIQVTGRWYIEQLCQELNFNQSQLMRMFTSKLANDKKEELERIRFQYERN